jgi:hypothetical protein
MAEFPPSGELVLFGGAPRQQGQPWRNDTWLFDGDAWRAGPPAPGGLVPRGGASMAYLPTIGKLVLFGGASALRTGLADTWLFDGASWTRGPSAPPGMLGRAGAALAYLPSIGRLVLFGGSGSVPARDTWLFDGASWTRGPDAPNGIAPTYAGMARDAAGAHLIVAGGDGSADTWKFDGQAWTVGPDFPPGPRERASLAFDPSLGAPVVYGGMDSQGAESDLWALVGGTWTEVDQGPEPGPPGPRVAPGLANHSGLDALVMVAGIKATGEGTEGFRDTWLFRSPAARYGMGDASRADPGSAAQARPSVPGALRGPSAIVALGLAPASRSDGPGRQADQLVRSIGGRLYAGGEEIRLRGMNVTSWIPTTADLDRLGQSGFNLLRIHVRMGELEPAPPVFAHNQWVHSFEASYVDELRSFVADAAARGMYSILVLDGCEGGCYFYWPSWMLDSQYNSKGVNYPETDEGIMQADGDFWTDALRQTFMKDQLKYLAAQFETEPGVAALEILDEPRTGYLPRTHATVQLALDVQASIAAGMRTVDPARMIAFTTIGGAGAGVEVADLTPWAAIGNTVFDLHDSFGARWGQGLYDTTPQVLFQSVLSGEAPPYAGTTWSQEQFMKRVVHSVQPHGIAVLVGDAGIPTADRGAPGFFATTTSAANELAVSWAVGAWGSDLGIIDAQGRLRPYARIVMEAARAPW